MIGLPYNITMPIYTRGAGGVPSTVLELADQIVIAWEHSITDAGGFETGVLTLAGTVDEAVAILTTWLMCTTIVSSPDAETLYEGVCVSIEVDFGTERRALSLDGMGNKITVKFTDTLGAQRTANPVSHAGSIALYGTKERTLAFDKTSDTDATQKATRALAQLAQPVMQRSTGITASARDPDVKGATIRLKFVGYYYLMDWLTTSNTSSLTQATNTQITVLIAGYLATNNFFSSSFANIASTGISAPQTISPNTTYRKAIEALAESGNASGQAMAWGILDNRTFYLSTSAEATPNTVTYRRGLGSARIYDTFGSFIPWWKIRPNAIYEVQDLLDPVLTVGSPDSAGRHYIARTHLSLTPDAIQLSLEGRQGQPIDKILARLR